MEGIDALNIMKQNLEEKKTDTVVPRGQKVTKKPLVVDSYVGTYVM